MWLVITGMELCPIIFPLYILPVCMCVLGFLITDDILLWEYICTWRTGSDSGLGSAQHVLMILSSNKLCLPALHIISAMT